MWDSVILLHCCCSIGFFFLQFMVEGCLCRHLYCLHHFHCFWFLYLFVFCFNIYVLHSEICVHACLFHCQKTYVPSKPQTSAKELDH